MRVHLGGHLSWYESERRAWLDVDLPQPATPLALLAALGVPAGEVAVVTVNRQTAALDGVTLADGDTVEFFPPVGGGCQVGRLGIAPRATTARRRRT